MTKLLLESIAIAIGWVTHYHVCYVTLTDGELERVGDSVFTVSAWLNERNFFKLREKIADNCGVDIERVNITSVSRL